MYLTCWSAFVTFVMWTTLGEDMVSSVHLINDVTAGMECTVYAIGTDKLHKVKHGERIRVDPLFYVGAGYFLSCGVGVSSGRDLERSEMEGIFQVDSTGSTESEIVETAYYMSSYLSSITRVVRNDLTADRLLEILNS